MYPSIILYALVLRFFKFMLVKMNGIKNFISGRKSKTSNVPQTYKKKVDECNFKETFTLYADKQNIPPDMVVKAIIFLSEVFQIRWIFHFKLESYVDMLFNDYIEERISHITDNTSRQYHTQELEERLKEKIKRADVVVKLRGVFDEVETAKSTSFEHAFNKQNQVQNQDQEDVLEFIQNKLPKKSYNLLETSFVKANENNEIEGDVVQKCKNAFLFAYHYFYQMDEKKRKCAYTYIKPVLDKMKNELPLENYGYQVGGSVYDSVHINNKKYKIYVKIDGDFYTVKQSLKVLQRKQKLEKTINIKRRAS